MKDVTDENETERLKWKQECFEARIREQEEKKDYSFIEAYTVEKCDDCGCPINSHGHCPRCDY